MSIKRIVVKVGTNVISQDDGLLNLTALSHLVDQLTALKKAGCEVLLVSSGAVGAGKSLIKLPKGLSKLVRRQVLASVGQVRLMELYRQFFANQQLFCAQVLATREDFRDRIHYNNMQQCLNGLLRDDIIPIINENDVVAVNELMFTDNDELAGLVAAMINADTLVLLSSVDGLLDGPPSDSESKVIEQIGPFEDKWKKLILPTKSSQGRGGMATKYRIAQKAAQVGIHTIIANGGRSGILLDIWNGNYIGTSFQPAEPLSNVKKWIAYNEDSYKGKVVVNSGAKTALNSDQATSLLPIGIVRIEGQFAKGDLIRILAEDAEEIGVGIAQYDSEKANNQVGKAGSKPLVHYDYLYLETRN